MVPTLTGGRCHAALPPSQTCAERGGGWVEDPVLSPCTLRTRVTHSSPTPTCLIKGVIIKRRVVHVNQCVHGNNVNAQEHT
eukprot:1449482-Prymnesium_polylepis.2